jgi:hypothetical protein
MKSLFGVTVPTLLYVWKEISKYGPETLKMEHLLMGLYFLKVYPTEHVASGTFQVDEKTWRKWIKIVVERISKLNLVGLFFFF